MRNLIYIPCLICFLATPVTAEPMNVIFFVGDGMGFEAVNAARMFDNNDTTPLFFETFTHTGSMTHNNAGGDTTDSAAAGTAMATGVKVNNGVISIRQPGDEGELPTVLEIMSAAGKRTGLVTSHTYMTDATPAAFGAHAANRSENANIADDYLTQTRPNVLFGRTQSDLVADAPGAGYDLVTTLVDFNAINPNTFTYNAGLFSSSEQPTLAAMTTTALNILNNDTDGFFLLVEHEDTDSGGHANELDRVVDGVLELDDAVQAAHNWVSNAGLLGDTLIVVTADHETGGLDVIANNGAGVLPDHDWSTTGHTQTPVPVYATGPNADASRVTGVIDNTDIHYILTSTEPGPNPGVTVSFQQGVDGYTGTIDTFVQEHEDEDDNDNSAVDELNVDGDDPADSFKDAQALLRFESIFGTGTGQIPLDKDILKALLIVEVNNSGDPMDLHRMLATWADTDTWNSLGAGITADDFEAVLLADASSGETTSSVWAIDVTASLQAWQADPSGNHGWAFLPTDTDGVDFYSAEGSNPPKLTVTFVPEPASLALLGIGSLLSLGIIRRRRKR
jgi:alkaline phosphatase